MPQELSYRSYKTPTTTISRLICLSALTLLSALSTACNDDPRSHVEAPDGGLSGRGFMADGSRFRVEDDAFAAEIVNGELSMKVLAANAGALLRIATASVDDAVIDSQTPSPGELALGGVWSRAVGSAIERMRVTEGGIEQSWAFAAAPEHGRDIVVTVGVRGLPFLRADVTGLLFGTDGQQVRYGHGTWIDARGERSPVEATFEHGIVTLRVPAEIVERSVFPAVLDPVVGPAIDLEPFVSLPVDADDLLLASNGTDALACWNGKACNGIDSNGTLTSVGGVQTAASGSSLGGSMTFCGDHYVRTWVTSSGVFARRLDSTGHLVGPESIRISNTQDAHSASVACAGTRALIVWDDSTRRSQQFARDVFGKLLEANGDVSSQPIIIAQGSYSALAPVVHFGHEQFLVVWEDSRTPSASGFDIDSTMYGARLSVAGELRDPLGGFEVAPASRSRGARIASDDLGYFVVWTSNDSVIARRISPTEGPQGDVLRIASGSARSLDVTWDGEHFVVLWKRTSRAPYGTLFASRVSSTGAIDGPFSILEDFSSPAALVSIEGGWLVVFSKARPPSDAPLLAQRFDMQGVVRDEAAFVVSTSINIQSNPAIAFGEDGYLAAWEDRRSAAKAIFVERLDRSGHPRDAAARSVPAELGSQSSPAVASDGRDFLVVYELRRDEQEPQVRGARFSAQGELLDAAPLVFGQGWYPKVSYASGHYIVGWRSEWGQAAYRRLTTAGRFLDPAPLDVRPPTATRFAGLASGPSTHLFVFEGGSSQALEGKLLYHNGQSVGKGFTLGTWATGTPVPRWGRDRYLVGWAEASGGGRVASVDEFERVSVPSAYSFTPAEAFWVELTWTGDEFLAVAESFVNGRRGLNGFRLSASGFRIGDPILIASQAPAFGVASSGRSDAVVVYGGDISDGIVDGIAARHIDLAREQGDACTRDTQCTSGFCADGFCCESACGGPTDCMACSSNLTGQSKGLCRPVVDMDLDGDKTCDLGDLDDDGDGVSDAIDRFARDARRCSDLDRDQCDDCSRTTQDPTNDGEDFDKDGLCDLGDSDDDNDTASDGVDIAPYDRSRCADGDKDRCDDCALQQRPVPQDDGVDTDRDGLCDQGDGDDDGDQVADAQDEAPLDPARCYDRDQDRCDDCVGGRPMPRDDGTDLDADGLCDVGDADDDGDAVDDALDSAPLDRFRCGDSDQDRCDDCASGKADKIRDGDDYDADGLCDQGDDDDDGDTVNDAEDNARQNASLCRDADQDGCDDCAVRAKPTPSEDGLDTDRDGACNLSDQDDDGDSVADRMDAAPLDPRACRDEDGDGCDDCVSGRSDVAHDGADFDSDGLCDAGDSDDDGDAVRDAVDAAPQDPARCRDSDQDTCDDCALGKGSAPNADGTDTDNDGTCDAGDEDDDGDTVADSQDSSSLDPQQCSDADSDGCDDCQLNKRPTPMQDGLDGDGDGLCNGGDADDDGDGVDDAQDAAPLDRFRCGDADHDGCEDCDSGKSDQARDGADFDRDGLCDAGDDDDDGDTVKDANDGSPQDASACSDEDRDGCDDCAILTKPAPNQDGPDGDGDGTCNTADEDDDGDSVADQHDDAPVDPHACSDQDKDGCNDCVTGRFDLAHDGDDADGDGLCDAGDSDDDGDLVPDAQDASPHDASACADKDKDGCDDCALGKGAAPDADGSDTDGDGSCDLGDADDDGDSVADGEDDAPRDAHDCLDADHDGCDDCQINGRPTPKDDGADADSNGICDAGDADDDGDGIEDEKDAAPLDRFRCGDADHDGCEDCDSGKSDQVRDGADFDRDGLCDAGDDDDDGDTVTDANDRSPQNASACSDEDRDGCDDCALLAKRAPDQDGPDSDVDGICNAADEDDDGDSVADQHDDAPLDSRSCSDQDKDGCNDCVTGRFDLAHDGDDADGDGLCDAGDSDDDGDLVPDAQDGSPHDPSACADNDKDGCDDCALGKGAAPNADGTDTDGDGACDLGDADDDGDSVPDNDDGAPRDAHSCLDGDRDSCDDCATNGRPTPKEDGTDADSDGLCDTGDADDDNDGVDDPLDATPLDRLRCGDADHDSCEDCQNGKVDRAHDGDDFDGDGLCDAGDSDDDGDLVPDAQDAAPHDASACTDNDQDGCDDCALGKGAAPHADGIDTDGDGTCDSGEPDGDGDSIPDEEDDVPTARPGAGTTTDPSTVGKDPPQQKHGSSGCSVAAGPDRADEPTLLMLLVALAVFVRERRSRRCS